MPDDTLIRTALTDRHEAAGAKMAPFAGWLMPLEFAGTVAEHHAVRGSVGVFDVSHLGTVLVTGSGAADVIGRSFTCDPQTVEVGASQYTLCCTDGGGVVDDLIVYHLTDDAWMVVPNAANTAAVVARLNEQVGATSVDVADESTAHAILAVQGPAALDLATRVTGVDVGTIPYLGLRRVALATGGTATVCRTGYTGEPGCEIVCPNDAAGPLWDALVDAGAVPAGLGARDTLRLEMGYPLHGNDLSVDVNPYEARLGWAVKLDHGDFVGRDALVRIKEAGPTRRLWGLRGAGRRPLRAGLDVRVDGVPVGRTSSGGFSPTLELGVGLALLATALEPGAHVEVDVRGRGVPAEVVRPPFVDRNPKG
jgi:aminomethyltransferase